MFKVPTPILLNVGQYMIRIAKIDALEVGLCIFWHLF